MSSRKDGENRNIGTPPAQAVGLSEGHVYIGTPGSAGKGLGASLPVMHTGKLSGVFYRPPAGKAPIPKILSILENTNK
jgi:hypothetical protein